MINQVLTEMDGMNVKKNVFIIGATNRFVNYVYDIISVRFGCRNCQGTWNLELREQPF